MRNQNRQATGWNYQEHLVQAVGTNGAPSPRCQWIPGTFWLTIVFFYYLHMVRTIVARTEISLKTHTAGFCSVRSCPRCDAPSQTFAQTMQTGRQRNLKICPKCIETLELTSLNSSFLRWKGRQFQKVTGFNKASPYSVEFQTISGTRFLRSPFVASGRQRARG